MTRRIGASGQKVKPPLMAEVINQVHVKHGAQDWLGRGAQLLDEHHLVAWSRNLAFRERFGLEIAWFLMRLPQSEVVSISGQTIRDIDGLCSEFDRALAVAHTHAHPGPQSDVPFNAEFRHETSISARPRLVTGVPTEKSV